jgi:putative phage-type endonuclease
VIRIEKQEMYNSLGLGASEVAAALHLDPWKSAYELWKLKTGRMPKPPKTPAMRYGIEMEAEAFKWYAAKSGLPGLEQQVACRHPVFDWMRCYLDVWYEPRKVAVNIKCPSSQSLMRSVRRGVIPAHYLAQAAAEMDMSGAEAWQLFVWMKNGQTVDSQMAPVSWDTEMFDDRSVCHPDRSSLVTLRDWWEGEALPGLELFWARVLADQWTVDGYARLEDLHRWDALGERRDELSSEIAALYEEKDTIEARLKLLVGDAKSAAGERWCASWSSVSGSYELVLKCDSKEDLDHLETTIAGRLSSVQGVKAVERREKSETYRFSVKPVKGEDAKAPCRESA